MEPLSQNFEYNIVNLCNKSGIGIMSVQFNRPRVKNAFNDACYEELISVFKLAGEDERISCIILTGMGDFFSSGADVKTSFSRTKEEYEAMGSLEHSPAGRFMLAIMRCPKLVVAAVNGPAVGIGATLLAHCDLVFMSSEAYLWAPFFQLALVPEHCSSLLFPLIMGQGRAGRVLYLGEKLGAQEALDCGLITKILPSTSNILEETQNAMEEILRKPLAAMTSVIFKQLLRGTRLTYMEETVKSELAILTQRIKRGDPAQTLKSTIKSNTKASYDSITVLGDIAGMDIGMVDGWI
eukprot:CAMPEP_0113938074 /NCGR_PEP_ID=MMETSP1339-20121228/4493_1 /TAXON_ID=94617 /ORGANISM="Fibrocapsa japonica" /LENGTH=294 /DNA_ID=CAMNT_0000941011 /DNA_START=43 /DNA_END=928 /DNA_ORIENTATION=+ /assembly_acc=CAM_ASM_000762